MCHPFVRMAVFAGLGVSLTAGLTGCSSGPSVNVALTGNSSVRLGASTQFSASVTGTSNTAVTWQVDGVKDGSAATGTISNTGLYTAPLTMPSGSSVVVSAVSQADANASGTMVESLLNPVAQLQSGSATQIGSSLIYAVDLVGSGYVPNSIIQVNGSPQTTTYVSGSELQANVTVPSGTTSITVAVANPNPGANASSDVTVPVRFINTTQTAAARILDQTTFGPTSTLIQHVQSLGVQAYLNEQFAQPTTALAAIPTNPLPNLCLSANTAYPCAESEWFQTVITGNDQLRQRVAFALSEIFVVSTQSVPGQAIPAYHNMLANDAFGNFATIMHDVTLSPAMGAYLNMLNSAKPATGQIANENYPRELMQLFTLGLNKLNQDGTLQLDGSGNPIPVYTQFQVQAFAKAYTGWTFATASGASPTSFPNATANYSAPMAAVESAHDTSTKNLLNGTVLPGGQTAAQDLSDALANIFAEANVAPFVCKQLIQHLVTSTPSPAYVSRVAAVFANSGSGVRGDMQAVITAILLDPEARAGDTNPAFDGGHLREPVLFLTAMMRALQFTNTDTNGSWDSLANYANTLSERPYRSGSVFNFFAPGYVIPGTTLNAPEFGIENTATAVLRLSLADAIVNNKISSFKVDLSNTSTLGTLAANPSSLVDTLSVLLMHGQMPPDMRSTILSVITPLTSNAQRVRIAVYLIVTSSQYKVIH